MDYYLTIFIYYGYNYILVHILCTINSKQGTKMKQKYPNHVVKKIAEEDTGHEYSLLSIESQGKKDPLTGKTMKRKMSLQHNECGHTYEIDIYEFIEGKRRCGKCKGKGLREHFVESIESIKEKTGKLTDGEYSFIDDSYVNSKTKHWFQHNTCGTKFEKNWDKFKGTPKQLGQRCPECSKKGMESAASRYVRDVLDHLHVEYVCEKRFDACRNPKTGRILPFDYYLPEINTIVEIDGEQHERDSFKKIDDKYDPVGTIERDKIKDLYLKENGVELVRIPAKKWSLLPEFLFEILSKNLIPTLTLEEVKEIPQATHPERINKDLLSVHNGEYQLHDNYYFGVDRHHNFIHKTCGTVFTHTLDRLKREKYPCPMCRGDNLKRGKHNESNKQLHTYSKGRYSLDDSCIGIDDKGRRLVQCNRCHTSWSVTVGNLMKDKAGCPSCQEIQKDKEWKEICAGIMESQKDQIKLNKSQVSWLWHNRNKHKEGKLKPKRVEFLQESNLI